jgi:Fe-S-cluster containining protein
VARDCDLIQIVDAAMAEAARKSGDWLVCRPGCAECCMGPFPITFLDAARLRSGLEELTKSEPARAARVRRRASEAIARMPEFPGDLSTGVLTADDEAEERFTTLAEDEPCPALDPDTKTCDLYEARPITCRIFGPAVRCGGDVLGACELNYVGATDEQIVACQVEINPQSLETDLLRGDSRETLVAFALAGVAG